MYIPEGYGTVFPYMIVADASAFAEFLTEAFGASEAGRTELPNGRIANIRLSIGTSTFMVSEVDGETLEPMPAAYYIYVEDVDRSFAAALANGASEIFAPTDMPYRDRQGGVADPFGNLWWISKRLVDAPYDA